MSGMWHRRREGWRRLQAIAGEWLYRFRLLSSEASDLHTDDHTDDNDRRAGYIA